MSVLLQKLFFLLIYFLCLFICLIKFFENKFHFIFQIEKYKHLNNNISTDLYFLFENVDILKFNI